MLYIAKTCGRQIEISHFYTYYRNKKRSSLYFSGQRHTFWEMNVILRGEMTLTCEDTIINLKKGEMYLIPPHAFHKFRVTDSEPLELLVLTFDAAFEPEQAVYRLSADNMALVHMLAAEIEGRFPVQSFNGAVQAPQIIKTLTETLLLRAAAYDAIPVSKDRASDLYGTAVRLMHANLFGRLTLDGIASHCNVSPSTLKNIFKTHTAGGVMQFFLRMKMEHAKKMLREGNSVNAVADALAFSSAAHFSAAFKRTFGVSPLAYKQGAGEKNSPALRT